MTQGNDILYFGTFVMLLLSFCFIGFILWATTEFQKQKKYAEQRDKHYMERIEAVEALVKTEFKHLISHLKNI